MLESSYRIAIDETNRVSSCVKLEKIPTETEVIMFHFKYLEQPRSVAWSQKHKEIKKWYACILYSSVNNEASLPSFFSSLTFVNHAHSSFTTLMPICSNRFLFNPEALMSRWKKKTRIVQGLQLLAFIKKTKGDTRELIEAQVAAKKDE